MDILIYKDFLEQDLSVLILGPVNDEKDVENCIRIPENSFLELQKYVRNILAKVINNVSGPANEYEDLLIAEIKTNMSALECIEDGEKFIYYFDLRKDQILFEKTPKKINSESPTKDLVFIKSKSEMEIEQFNHIILMLACHDNPIAKITYDNAIETLESIVSSPEDFSEESF